MDDQRKKEVNAQAIREVFLGQDISQVLSPSPLFK